MNDLLFQFTTNMQAKKQHIYVKQMLLYNRQQTGERGNILP